MPILLTNGGDDANLHCYIARYSKKKHYCCIPFCPKPEIGAGTSLKFVYKVKICNNYSKYLIFLIIGGANQYSNGIDHIRGYHCNLVAWDKWTSSMKEKRKKEWSELERTAALNKRKAQTQLKVTDKVPLQTRSNIDLLWKGCFHVVDLFVIICEAG